MCNFTESVGTLTCPEGTFDVGHALAPTELYCTACGRILAVIGVGGTCFERLSGDTCACGWRCCAACMAETHAAHLAYRPAKGDEPLYAVYVLYRDGRAETLHCDPPDRANAEAWAERLRQRPDVARAALVPLAPDSFACPGCGG